MAAEILDQYVGQVDPINLHGGVGGAFEVVINGELVYSKLQTKRLPEYAEISDAIKARLS